MGSGNLLGPERAHMASEAHENNMEYRSYKVPSPLREAVLVFREIISQSSRAFNVDTTRLSMTLIRNVHSDGSELFLKGHY